MSRLSPMQLRIPSSALPCLSLLLVSAACAATRAAPEPALVATEEAADALPVRPPRPLDDEGIVYVLAAQPGFPRVRYLDGQLSLNESCAIRVENKLSRKIPPVYVNGQPIGFC